MSAAPVAGLSVEEYLAGELTAERPSEYHDGELFPVAFATINHARLVNRLPRRIDERLDSGRCEILSQIRVRVSPGDLCSPIKQ